MKKLGLGTVWVCYFKPDVIKKEFSLPDNLEPVNILAIGYSDEKPLDTERHSSMRKPMTELVSYLSVMYLPWKSWITMQLIRDRM